MTFIQIFNYIQVTRVFYVLIYVFRGEINIIILKIAQLNLFKTFVLTQNLKLSYCVTATMF